MILCVHPHVISRHGERQGIFILPLKWNLGMDLVTDDIICICEDHLVDLVSRLCLHVQDDLFSGFVQKGRLSFFRCFFEMFLVPCQMVGVLV